MNKKRKSQRRAGEAQPGQSSTPAPIAPSGAEKQEIAAATARYRKRPPRVATNIKQHENAAVKISPELNPIILCSGHGKRPYGLR